MRRYFGIDKATLAARIPALLEFAGLAHRGDAGLRMLSGGIKRRLTLASRRVHHHADMHQRRALPLTRVRGHAAVNPRKYSGISSRNTFRNIYSVTGRSVSER